MRYRNAKAFTFLEVLLSLSLSLIIVMASYESYKSFVLIQKKQQSIETLKNNLRFFYVTFSRQFSKVSALQGYTTAQLKKIVGHNVRAASAGIAINNITYFIARTSYKNAQHKSVYALYKKAQGRRREELIPEINRLKLHYKTVDATALQGATAVKDWSKVIGALFTLTTSTRFLPQQSETWEIYFAVKKTQ